MKTNPKLSIIIPVYNEKDTINKIVIKVQNVEFEKEIIIVDDCSNDGTGEKIKRISDNNIKKLFHEKNEGKSAALRTYAVLVGMLETQHLPLLESQQWCIL